MDNLKNFMNKGVKISDYVESVNLFDDRKNKKVNFSVIIPCYNTGETIERTVASVLKQTLEDVEIVIVDDASTDRQTIKKLKELEKYVKVIYLEKNGGISQTRNIGLRYSYAEYTLCLDSDDFIESTFLEKAKKIFDRNDRIGVVSPSVQMFGVIQAQWKPKENFSLSELLATNQVPGAASCVRRSVYDDVGMYDVSLRSYEDWELWIRVFSSNSEWKNEVIPEFLFFYFIHRESGTHSMDKAKMSKTLDIILKKHERLYKDNALEIFKNLHIHYTTNRLDSRENVAKIREKEERLVEKDNQILELKQSKSFQLGSLFFRSVQKPYKLLTYPYNFIKILLKK